MFCLFYVRAAGVSLLALGCHSLILDEIKMEKQVLKQLLKQPLTLLVTFAQIQY